MIGFVNKYSNPALRPIGVGYSSTRWIYERTAKLVLGTQFCNYSLRSQTKLA